LLADDAFVLFLVKLSALCTLPEEVLIVVLLAQYETGRRNISFADVDNDSFSRDISDGDIFMPLLVIALMLSAWGNSRNNSLITVVEDPYSAQM